MTGRPGIYCGSPVPATSPFAEADIVGFPVPGRPEPSTEDDFGQIVEQEYSLQRSFETNVQASLENALATTGVSPAVVERLKGDIKAAASGVRNVAARARGTFRQYQLQPRLIAELQSDEVSPRLASCARMLATGEWDMYQAISGWSIDEATYASTETNRITTDLTAKVAALDPTVNLADLTAKLNLQATTAVRTTQFPNFRVIGVSYFDPIRIGSAADDE
nr:hypothetical protein [Brevundimonas diminuta]